MPGLVLFGRRWSVSSDDFVFPGCLEFLLRICWFILLSAVYYIHRNEFNCDSGHIMQSYYIGMILLIAFHMVDTIIGIYTSMQGAIMNPNPRRHFPKLLYIKIILVVPEICLNIMGTYWAFSGAENCEKHIITTVKVAVITGWLVGIVVFIGILVVFDPFGGEYGRYKNVDQIHSQTTRKVWEYRCRLFCCCIGRDDYSTDAFTDIAKIFADFFNDIDIVPTDIMAGFLLLQMEEEVKQMALKKEVEVNGTEATDLDHITVTSTSSASPEIMVTSHDNWTDIGQVEHYMKFAMASYGWPLFMFMNIGTGCCQLLGECQCNNLSCCECSREAYTNNSGEKIVDDNCCQCHVTAIMKFTDIDEEDIIYACFHNKVYEIPFYVAVDHNHKSVIVAIRGTLSLRDALTDMTAESERMDVPTLADVECFAHKGILQAAEYIRAQLNHLQILEQSFRKWKDYQLVITGHSLGAGAGALLSVLLKPKYPNLLCYAMSPPGGLLSESLSEFTQSFVCSVVLGKDLVPRLGLKTIGNLKNQLSRVLNNCKLPKYKILANGLWYILCGMPERQAGTPPVTPEHDNSSQPLLGSVTTGAGYSQVNSTEHQNAPEINVDVTGEDEFGNSYPTLYPPGRIIYVQRIPGAPGFSAHWSRAEEFEKITVSSKMVLDHLPDEVYRALHWLVRNDTDSLKGPIV